MSRNTISALNLFCKMDNRSTFLLHRDMRACTETLSYCGINRQQSDANICFKLRTIQFFSHTKKVLKSTSCFRTRPYWWESSVKRFVFLKSQAQRLCEQSWKERPSTRDNAQSKKRAKTWCHQREMNVNAKGEILSRGSAEAADLHQPKSLGAIACWNHIFLLEPSERIPNKIPSLWVYRRSFKRAHHLAAPFVLNREALPHCSQREQLWTLPEV